ncbi:MAG: ABC transporter substrate-binding protein, partial [Nitrospirota bacterium]
EKRMNRRLKIIISFTLLLLLVPAMLVFAKGEKETYKIGVVAPMSLDYAFIGDAMKNSLTLAKEQLIVPKFNYEFIFEDSQNDSKLNASAAHKLIDVDKVDAILTLGATAGPIITPLATKAKVLHYSVSVQPYIAEGLTNFIHWAPSKALNDLLAEEMKRRGIKKYGVFRETTYEGFKFYLDDLTKAANKLGLKMVTDQTFLDTTKDFRTQIANAKGSGAEIYVLFMGSPAIEILTKQLREAGDKTPLTSVESFELTTQKDLFEGLWYVSSGHPTREYAEAYKKRFNMEPAVGGPNAYDMFLLIDHAIKNTGSEKKPTSEQVAKELLKIKNFPGSLGSLTIIEPGITMSDVDLKIIKNGEPVKLDR